MSWSACAPCSTGSRLTGSSAHHVRAYLGKRGETAKARANRETALLRHLFNRAREWAGHGDWRLA